MKSEELKKLISQIKKYDLTKTFETSEEFDKWLSRLNSKQIHNFNSLTIEPSSIMFPISLIIDENLLNCDDYTRRIEAMSQLKNGDGCWHLFNRLCSPNFLNSKSYYKDIEMISKADTARYALRIINENAFINSPYHDDDLKLVVETHDVNEDNPLHFVVSDALATVASNIDSIKSPYHQADMQLISTVESDCLQMSHSYPEHSLNNLAVNKVSLSDKYHLENMQILAKNSIASEYLYNIMTNPNIIKGKNYRAEVEALVNAKSEVTAIAIYHYIANPKNIDMIDFYDVLSDCDLDYHDIGLLGRRSRVKGNLNKNYLDNLVLLNKVEDKFVMYIENILSNEKNFNSEHQKYDIDLLLSITDKKIFMDLFRLMISDVSLFGNHHRHDATLISKTVNEKVRKLLLQKATNRYSIVSENHEYDMQYITKLDLENIDKEIYEKMHYYLFTSPGISHPEHIDRLEKLYRGEIIENYDNVLEHLNYLEKNPPIDEGKEPTNVKVLSRIRNIFKKR